MTSRRSQTGTIFRRYLALEDRFARWAKTQTIRLHHADSAQIANRLTQRLVSLTGDHFTDDILRRGGVEVVPAEDDLRANTLNGVTFDHGVISVRLSRSILLRGLYEFFGHWAILLLAILRGILTTKGAKGSFTLFPDVPIDAPSKVAGFVDFCAQGPIEPLSTTGRVIAQAKFEREAEDHVIFTARPVAFALSRLVPRTLLLRILALHLWAPVTYIAAYLRHPAMALLGEDAAVLPAMAAMDRAGLVKSIVVTLSRFRLQPLWMKGIAGQKSVLHMIWYSQNCIPKVYADEKVESDLPSLKHIRCDVHWVWTDGFADYLRNSGQSCRIEVVGPILFYLPAPPPPLPDGKAIVLFDIIPVASSAGVFGVAENYYSLSTIQQFVGDAVRATKELAIQRGEIIWCLLKHKRTARAEHHDRSYGDYIDQLLREHKHFRLIDPDVNLYGLLSATDGSVAVPYTTTCSAATAVGRRSAYYDVFAELVPRYEKLPGVEFASSYEELKAFIDSTTGPTSKLDEPRR